MATQYDFGSSVINVVGSLAFVQNYFCDLYDSDGQTITTATVTYINWDSEAYDPSGMHDPVTNNSRITPGAAGWYLLGASSVWVAGSSGIRWITISRNRTTQGTADRRTFADSSEATLIAFMEANGSTDYFEVAVYHTEGSNLQFSPDSRFWCCRIVGTP